MRLSPEATFDDGCSPESAKGPWSFLFSWTGFFLAAWVIYELTTQAVLGVTALCGKIGLDYLRTALWLRRCDPDRVRGKLAMWIFAAAGLWRAAVMGTALMFVIAGATAALAPAAGPAPGRPPREFVEAFLVAAFGFLVSGGCTLRAAWLALRHGRRIWLDAGIVQAWRANRWPPVAEGTNKASALIVTSLVVLLFPLILGMVIAIVATVPQVPRGQQVGGAPVVAGLASLVFLPVLILWARDVVERKIVASHPGECWGMEHCGVRTARDPRALGEPGA